jgi:hypothetical protein
VANPITSLWTMIRDWAVQPTQAYQLVPFYGPDTPPLIPNASYFRLWLKGMNLTHSRRWFTDTYPAVQSSVRLAFDKRADQTFTRVVGPSKEVLGPGVWQNYVLSELLPFNGGTVEIEAGLFALRGENHLLSTIGILADFSRLVTTPLTDSLGVIEKLAAGMESVLRSTQSGIHLAFHQGLHAGAADDDNALRPGFFAVLLATEQQIRRTGLSIWDGRLCYSPTPGAPASPLTTVDHMLFEIEGRPDRDNYRQLPDLLEPLDAFKEAIIRNDQQAEGAAKVRLLLALEKVPDLAQNDRPRIRDAFNKELKDLRNNVKLFGAAGGPAKTLDTIIAKWADPIENYVGSAPFKADAADFDV